MNNLTSLVKTSQPSAHLINRHEAVAAISAISAPMVWLVASGGSGKTSLCIDYTRSHAGPVGWLRLDAGDTDLTNFFHYLEQAIVNGGIAQGWCAPKLLREHLEVPDGYIRLFVRSLASAMAPDACLVIDDAHKCQNEPFFSDFLDVLGEELPRGVRILFCSRDLPPEGSARLLAYGRMVEFDVSLLAFSPAETEQLLALLGVANSTEICDAISASSNGWAVAIVIIAALLRHRPDAMAQADEKLPRLVLSYMAKEVFAELTSAEQEILLAVCWLPYFSGKLASALTGIADAEDILKRLADRGGLIYEYAGRQYTLHRLYQQFLRDLGNSRIEERRRLQWIEHSIQLLEADGDFDVAIELALEHGLGARAAALIESQAPRLYAAAQHQTLERWIDILPETLRGPWHYYWLGLSIFTSDTARARESLMQAYDAFVACGDQPRRFQALCWIIISYGFNGVARESLRDVMKRLTDAQSQYEQLPDDVTKAYLALCVFTGICVTEPGHPDLELWEQRALNTLSQPVDPTVKMRIVAWIGSHFYISGRYRRLSSLHALLDALPVTTSLSGHARYLYYYVPIMDALCRADHAALLATRAASRDCAEETGICYLETMFELNLAISQLLQGNLDAASAILSRERLRPQPSHYYVPVQIAAVSAWLESWRGDASAALEFAKLLVGFGHNSGNASINVWGHICECIAVSLLRAVDAPEKIAQLRQLGGETCYPLALIHADLLDAWRYLQAGERGCALTHLRAALTLFGKESEGYLALGVPQILQPLCALALRENIEVASARSLIRVFRLTPPADAAASWPWRLSLRAFGGFELMIDGKPMVSYGKSKHRQLELIRLVAAHAPTALPIEKITDTLWPDSEGDAAQHALKVTLARTCVTFGRNVFQVKLGAISLDRNLCWLDTAALYDLLAVLEERFATGEAEPAKAAEEVLQLYRGELFSGESIAWLLPCREYWSNRAARFLSRAANALMASGEVATAMCLLEQATEANPHSESMVHALMRLCLDAGRFAEGIAFYRRFCRISASSRGVSVSAELESLAQCLLQQAAAANPAR